MESGLNPMRKRLIEVCVENLLRETQIGQPPFPVGTALEKLVALHSYCGKEGSGFCYSTPTEFHVYLNAERTEDNETYNLACALGHYRLEHFDRGRQWSAEQVEKAKVEAEYFADCLLMPEKWLRHDCAGRVVTATMAEELARRYDVPLAKLYRRMSYLRIG